MNSSLQSLRKLDDEQFCISYLLFCNFVDVIKIKWLHKLHIPQNLKVIW